MWKGFHGREEPVEIGAKNRCREICGETSAEHVISTILCEVFFLRPSRSRFLIRDFITGRWANAKTGTWGYRREVP